MCRFWRGATEQVIVALKSTNEYCCYRLNLIKQQVGSSLIPAALKNRPCLLDAVDSAKSHDLRYITTTLCTSYVLWVSKFSLLSLALNRKTFLWICLSILFKDTNEIASTNDLHDWNFLQGN
ncbi:LOW QUALITY PROTEIN: hypothetical protein HID58_052268 [Brassica napus]|uniref:Uncharacterized protein n=1 Tax=Brassica napus TaxID=3708 RepID=A0ABQ8ABF8_BRANA|nr:LOW QUALITY PROTEIN: hypothetical protein HID58_052268 [Brassica napus]